MSRSAGIICRNALLLPGVVCPSSGHGSIEHEQTAMNVMFENWDSLG